MDAKGINGVQGITIDMNKPEYVDVSTLHNQDVDEFHVQDGFANGTVSISVNDQGKMVMLTVHAVEVFAKVDATWCAARSCGREPGGATRVAARTLNPGGAT